MKVNVKGLVFVGFAAAVFASSAMAAGENIVTSKHYVDNKFQTLENLTTSTETADWTSDTEYPSMKVVETRVGALTPAVGSPNATDYLNFSKEGNTLTVDLDNAPATAATDLTGAVNGSTGVLTAPTGNDLKKLVTAGAVNALIQAETAQDTTNITSAVAGNGTVPTTKNVYDFVTSAISTAGQDYQRKLGSSESGLYVGAYDANNDNTWKELVVADVSSGSNLSNTNYVTKSVSGNVYTVNLDAAQVGTAGTDVTASSTKLATGKAVYEYVQSNITTTSEGTIATNTTDDVNVPTIANVYNFVTNYASDTYQVKNTTNKLMVGYGNAWREIKALGDTSVAGATTSYVTFTPDDANNPTSYTVNIAGQAVTTAGTAIAAYDATTNSGDGTDLTTVKAVKEYVASQVDTQFALGTNPCATANGAASGAYCALVAHYDSTAGGAVYEWTVIAEPVAQNP